MMTTLYETFRCFGGLSLVSLGAIAAGETMLFVETSVVDFLRRRRDL
jgi:hypothetical protein